MNKKEEKADTNLTKKDHNNTLHTMSNSFTFIYYLGIEITIYNVYIAQV